MAVSLDCGDEKAQAAALLGRKRFGGRKHEGPWNKTRKSGVTACERTSRYVGQRPGRYPQDTAESFVKWSSAGLLHSPAGETLVDMWQQRSWKETLCPGGDTHTHTSVTCHQCLLLHLVEAESLWWEPGTWKSPICENWQLLFSARWRLLNQARAGQLVATTYRTQDSSRFLEEALAALFMWFLDFWGNLLEAARQKLHLESFRWCLAFPTTQLPTTAQSATQEKALWQYMTSTMTGSGQAECWLHLITVILRHNKSGMECCSWHCSCHKSCKACHVSLFIPDLPTPEFFLEVVFDFDSIIKVALETMAEYSNPVRKTATPGLILLLDSL